MIALAQRSKVQRIIVAGEKSASRPSGSNTTLICAS
jgi:hypothetical protein